MAELNDLISKLGGLEAAIENALSNEVADVVRQVIVESARENVYNAYKPQFLSRRNGDGGILDPKSIRVEAHGTELIASDDAQWQQLWGGAVPSERLAEAIASGDRRFNMHNAGPRPFHEKAKERLIAGPEIENALRQGLARQGYDTSGMTFEFI